eukprot:2999759-Rhodomonas_salina.1
MARSGGHAGDYPQSEQAEPAALEGVQREVSARESTVRAREGGRESREGTAKERSDSRSGMGGRKNYMSTLFLSLSLPRSWLSLPRESVLSVRCGGCCCRGSTAERAEAAAKEAAESAKRAANAKPNSVVVHSVEQ